MKARSNHMRLSHRDNGSGFPGHRELNLTPTPTPTPTLTACRERRKDFDFFLWISAPSGYMWSAYMRLFFHRRFRFRSRTWVDPIEKTLHDRSPDEYTPES